MRTRGFTLVELMVSIALFGLIASGAMMLVISGVRMQSHSARVDVAQSGARAGLDFLTRDLLSASAGMSGGLITINNVQTATIFVTPSAPNTTTPDQLDIYMADTNYDFGTVYNTGGVTAATTSITLDKTSQFTSGQNLLLSNLVNGVQFTAGGVTPQSSGSGTVGVSGTGLSAGLQSAAYPQYGSYVFALRHVTYKIGTPFPGGTTYLMVNMNDGRGDQPLAEGIEDFQVALGFDKDGNGTVDDFDNSSDEWIGNNSADDWSYATTVTNMTNLRAVRITLIAVSTSSENGIAGPRPRAEDHAAATTSDALFRRLIRTEVSVRNLNI
jgi:prepilin-type N-terminal cleavage/methylation domain-containing protein